VQSRKELSDGLAGFFPTPLLAARYITLAPSWGTHGSAAVQKLVTWFCTGLRSLLSGQLL
jgi:hypothetical protein